MDIFNVPNPAITQKLLVYPKDLSSLLLERPHGAHKSVFYILNGTSMDNTMGTTVQ